MPHNESKFNRKLYELENSTIKHHDDPIDEEESLIIRPKEDDNEEIQFLKEQSDDSEEIIVTNVKDCDF